VVTQQGQELEVGKPDAVSDAETSVASAPEKLSLPESVAALGRIPAGLLQPTRECAVGGPRRIRHAAPQTYRRVGAQQVEQFAERLRVLDFEMGAHKVNVQNRLVEMG